MQFFQKISRGLTHLAVLFCVSTAIGQTLPNGNYSESNFGPINLVCISPVVCHASYEKGQSFLYLTSPGQNGRFIGYWAEAKADKACQVTNQFPNIRTDTWGKVDIQFDPSGEKWAGVWGYCNDTAARQFNGARGQQSDQSNALVAGDQSLRLKLLGSWLPTADSNARRNDLHTFNPDGSHIISDGSGMNATGMWKLVNTKLYVDGEPIPLKFSGKIIKLAGAKFERYALNDEVYNKQSISGSFEPTGVYMSKGDSPKIGDYALRYIILGPSQSFEPGGAAKVGPPVYVEFWNETEPIKEDEAGNGYRNDKVVFEPQNFEVTAKSLSFFGVHSKWGELYFSADFDGHRIADLTSHALGGGPKPAHANQAVIRGSLMVKGHVFHDIELQLGFMH